MIRSLSGSPLLEDMLIPQSKFIGEALEMNGVRTIFAGAVDDKISRESSVTVLLGPSNVIKCDIIDFMCNYFYGTDPSASLRFNIANEKFNSQSPYRPIQCYIFNDTILNVRPVIIDTPAFGEGVNSLKSSEFIVKWLHDNSRMRIDAVGIVISDIHRMNSIAEDELQMVIDNLPPHVREKIIIFIAASDSARFYESLLRRLKLSHCPKFIINTTCIFEKPKEDKLNDEHRKRYWKASTKEFSNFYKHLQNSTPATISGQPFIEGAIYGTQYELSRNSSRLTITDHAESITTMSTNAPTNFTPPLPPKPCLMSRPSSPPPLPPTSSMPRPLQDNSLGIKLCSANIEKPRPPNFAPPAPPLEESKSDLDVIRHKTVMSSSYSGIRLSTYEPNEENRIRESDGQRISRRDSFPDETRIYSDEITPPPPITNVTERYTTVALMNNQPDPYVTRIRMHSPSRNISVRDAHRLSRENLQIIDKQSEIDRKTDVKEGIYYPDESNYYYGRINSSYGKRDGGEMYRKRLSRSSDTRSETFINEPFYPKRERSYNAYSTVDLRRQPAGLELVHSENELNLIKSGSNFDRRPLQKQNSEGKEIFIQRQLSPERLRKEYVNNDADIRHYRREVNVEHPTRHYRDVKEHESGENLYDAYSQINQHSKNRESLRIDNESRAIYDRYSDYGRAPNQYIIPNSMRGSRSPIQNVPQDVKMNYDPYGYIRNDKGTGLSEEKIVTTITTTREEDLERRKSKRDDEKKQFELEQRRRKEEEEKRKMKEEQEYKRRREERERERREEENRQKRYEEEQRRRNQREHEQHVKNYDAYKQPQMPDETENLYYDRDMEAALLEEKYDTKHLKRIVEYPQHSNYSNIYNPKNDSNKRISFIDRKNNNGRRNLTQKTTKSSKSIGSSFNCTNPKNCFLNFLFFVIAPLIIILIIIIIIIFVIIQ